MSDNSPIGNFEIIKMPPDTKAEDIFKDVPHIPAPFVPLTQEQKERFRKRCDRMRKSVEMRGNGELTTVECDNERLLINLCDRLGDAIVKLTPYEALEMAESARSRQDKVWYDYLAHCLELRLTYEVRVF